MTTNINSGDRPAEICSAMAMFATRPQLFIIYLLCLVLLFSCPASGGQEYCTLANDVARKAAKTMKTDPAGGLKLFIKAYDLCRSNDMAYNLGIAFYRYGNVTEAVKYLKQAVPKNDSRPIRLNNLACAVLDTGGDARFAMELAGRAVSLDNAFAPGFDTLAQAQSAAGDRAAGLKTIGQAAAAFKSAPYLKKTEQKLVEGYLTAALGQVRAGDEARGLGMLKAADFNKKVALTYCNALLRLGRFGQVLEQAGKYQGRFGGDEFSKIRSDVLQRQIQSFYVMFKNGRENKAVAAAKKFCEAHPGNAAAKKAYDELFDAFLGETGDISIPAAATAAAAPSRAGAGVDDLLGEIGNTPRVVPTDTNLDIDVETRIPEGMHKNQHAIALLMGNQEYRRMGKGMSDVKYAGRDVRIMRKYLETTLGYDSQNILEHRNLTSGDFRTLLGTETNPRGKLHNWIRPDKSDVFIYYVGHGCPGPAGRTAYLVPVDASADYIANNGYGLDLFYRIVEKLPARHLTVVLDACFSGDSASGPLFKNISPAMLKTTSPVRQIKNAALFCAADKDQVATWYPAKRHSLFSYFFFKGLQGAADRNNDRVIRLKELETYLNEEVKYHAGRRHGRTQTPLVLGDGDAVIAELKK